MLVKNISLIMALYTLSGCYIINQGIGQIEILSNAVHFDDVLKSNNFDKSTKEKIILVKQIKEYAKTKLGLSPTDSYNHYVDLRREYVAYNLSATYPDRLEPIYWTFPIIGKVPYLGFFKKEDAIKEQSKLKKRNLDTLLRGVSAYSTLGFFKDPLLSTVARFKKPILVNVVIHEMTHSTIFFKDNVAFNESLASFIGDMGTIAFLKETKGENSKWINYLNNAKSDKDIFIKFIDTFKKALNKLYSSPITKEEKIRKRQNIFKTYQKIFTDTIKPLLKTSRYYYFASINLNNSIILSFDRYNSSFFLLENLMKHFDNNLKNTIEFLKNMPPNIKKPKEYIMLWLKNKTS